MTGCDGMTRQMMHSLIHELNNCNTAIFNGLKVKTQKKDAVLVEQQLEQNIRDFEERFTRLSDIILLNKSTQRWLHGKIDSLRYVSDDHEIEEYTEDFRRILSFLKDHSKEVEKQK